MGDVLTMAINHLLNGIILQVQMSIVDGGGTPNRIIRDLSLSLPFWGFNHHFQGVSRMDQDQTPILVMFKEDVNHRQTHKPWKKTRKRWQVPSALASSNRICLDIFSDVFGWFLTFLVGFWRFWLVAIS